MILFQLVRGIIFKLSFFVSGKLYFILLANWMLLFGKKDCFLLFLEMALKFHHLHMDLKHGKFKQITIHIWCYYIYWVSPFLCLVNDKYSALLYLLSFKPLLFVFVNSVHDEIPSTVVSLYSAASSFL